MKFSNPTRPVRSCTLQGLQQHQEEEEEEEEEEELPEWTAPPTAIKKPTATCNVKGKKLVVYPGGSRNAGEGNLDYSRTVVLARFDFFDPAATKKMKNDIVQTIFNKYRFSGLTTSMALAKILKAVSEKRGFFEKLTNESDRQKYSHLHGNLQLHEEEVEEQHEPPESSIGTDTESISSRTALTAATTEPVASCNVEGKKLVVYPGGSRNASEGNLDYSRTVALARFDFFDPDATQEMKNDIIRMILKKYRFSGLTTSMAIAKILKAVSEKRGFFEKLTNESDRQKYSHLRGNLQFREEEVEEQHEPPESSVGTDTESISSRTAPTAATTEPVTSCNVEGKKLVVYSKGSRFDATGEGNLDYNRTVSLARFTYLDPDATQEMKNDIIQMILKKYHYDGLTTLKAMTKIFKAVSEKRGFFEKLTNESDRQKYSHLRGVVRDGGKRLYEIPVLIDDPSDQQKPAKRSKQPKEKSHYLHQFMDGSYVEELAFHYYFDQFSSDAELDQLDPLPPPPSEIPTPPPSDNSDIDSMSISWSYDPESRIYLGNFSRATNIPNSHKEFVGHLMERDDITVICEGLYDHNINTKQFLSEFGRCFGENPYGKFRQFNRKQTGDNKFASYEEVDGYSVRNVSSDYLNYLAQSVYGAAEFDSCTFDSHTIADSMEMSGPIESDDSVNEQCIYMTDVEMATHFPRFDRDYKLQFKMKEILPGGTWCLMNHVRSFDRFSVSFQFPYSMPSEVPTDHFIAPFAPLASGTIPTVHGTKSLYFARYGEAALS
jgi:hypothetical protein